MTIKIDNETSNTNILSFEKYKNNTNKKHISTTIAAIIALNIDHSNNIDPEEYLINLLEKDGKIEILAFEDALDSITENYSSNKNHNNFINDAWFNGFVGKLLSNQPFSLILLPS